jgi:hypothetical protein
MIRKAIKYLFPKLGNRQKLPLLPLSYSSDAKTIVPGELSGKVNQLKMAAVARTDRDAIRLIEQFPDLTAKQIITLKQRVRKRSNKWVRAWDRLKARW